MLTNLGLLLMSSVIAAAFVYGCYTQPVLMALAVVDVVLVRDCGNWLATRR